MCTAIEGKRASSTFIPSSKGVLLVLNQVTLCRCMYNQVAKNGQ